MVPRVKEEYSSLVPPLPDKEFQELSESLRKNGYWSEFSITVNKQGTVLDGHHRIKICSELNIEPTITIKDFDSELEEKLFVMDNLRTRSFPIHCSDNIIFNNRKIGGTVGEFDCSLVPRCK